MTWNNSTGICPHQQWYMEAGQKASFVVYFIVAPCHFFLGCFGHGTCLLAFYTQAKKEKAYVYQIFVTVSDALKSLAIGLYVVTVEWGASPRDTGFDWSSYRSCYSCMAFAAYLPIALVNTLITLSQLFSVCMSADRLYALWKPFKYKSTNHGRYQLLTAIFCLSLSVSTNLFHCFRFDVRTASANETAGTVSYRNVLNDAFASSVLGNALSQAQNAVQAAALLALCFFNTALLLMYRMRRKENRKATRESTRSSTGRKAKREKTERTLTLLAICQSCCVMTALLCKTLFYTVIFVNPPFYLCEGRLYAPLVVASRQAMDVCDLACVFAVSEQLRRIIRRGWICCHCHCYCVRPGLLSAHFLASKERGPLLPSQEDSLRCQMCIRVERGHHSEPSRVVREKASQEMA